MVWEITKRLMRIQFRLVAMLECVIPGGAWGISFGRAGIVGVGGHCGTCATRSRHVWRSFGDICDHFSAFFKNSARSASLMPANFA